MRPSNQSAGPKARWEMQEERRLCPVEEACLGDSGAGIKGPGTEASQLFI